MSPSGEEAPQPFDIRSLAAGVELRIAMKTLREEQARTVFKLLESSEQPLVQIVETIHGPTVGETVRFLGSLPLGEDVEDRSFSTVLRSGLIVPEYKLVMSDEDRTSPFIVPGVVKEVTSHGAAIKRSRQYKTKGNK